jgi:NADPH:quinone reductase-like Zn-dependent oxidoreductase
MDIALDEKHKAIVNNAAASALGKMLVILAKSKNIPLINIVRRDEQKAILTELGADFILSSESEGYFDELKAIAKKMNATLILDAVGGNAGSDLIEAAPKGSKIIAYAKLSGENIEIDSRNMLVENKSLQGFQLGNYLAQKSLLNKLKLGGRVKKFLEEQGEILIQKTYPLQDVNEAITLYTGNMSAGKVLIKM